MVKELNTKPPTEESPAKHVRRGGVLLLAAWMAIVPAGALALFALGGLWSRRASELTTPTNALPGVAATAALMLLLVYPLWPSPLLGGDPLERFGRWLVLRLVEVGVSLAVMTPSLVGGAVFSQVSLSRVAAILVGLSGTAVVAIVYRFVHEAASRRLRGLAVLDAVAFLFAPLAVGYLALEFYRVSISWGWLVSPLALGRTLALEGLTSAVFWVGIVGYGVAGLVGLIAALPLARRFDEMRRAQLL